MAVSRGQIRLADLPWLPDDTEESVVGAEVHQLAITTLYDSLRLAGPECGQPWFVGNQIVLDISRPDGTIYRPMPDIVVHPTAAGPLRTAFDTRVEGPPALIIEVVSRTTVANDRDHTKKPLWYAFAGVQEYLIFDPTAEFLGAQLHAYCAADGVFAPAPLGVDGRWHSAALGISFAPEGVLLRVYDGAGVLVPTVTELAKRNAFLEAELQRRQHDDKVDR